MGNISDLFSQVPLTVQKIYEYHERLKEEEEAPNQGRLGASSIGGKCERSLWYGFRGLTEEQFNGRMLRLFNRGHREENQFAEELRGIGCIVYLVNDYTQKQFEYTAIGGHFICHPDGKILGVPEAPKKWHILECKTAGGEETHSKDFEKIKKLGLKEAKPTYYAQTQVEMGLANLDRALFIIVKKANDEIWSERIHFNREEFKSYMEKAERIIRSINVPDRLVDRPDDSRCNFCSSYDLCWGSGDVILPIIDQTCRSCCHATPEINEGSRDPKWSCRKFNTYLSPEDQKQKCPYHLVLPGLISFAEPVNGCQDWIEFQNNDDGKYWRHGHELEGAIPTCWLLEHTREDLFSISEEIPFETCENLSLVDRYPPEDSYLICHRDGRHMDDLAEWKILGLPIKLSRITGTQNDDKYEAIEYGKSNLIIYDKKANHTYLWGGKE